MVVLLSCDTFWARAALFTLAWCFRQSIIMVWFTILKAALKSVRKRTAQPELTVRKIVSNELNSWKQTTFHIQVCCYHSNSWDTQCYEQQQGYGNGSKTAENLIIFRRGSLLLPVWNRMQQPRWPRSYLQWRWHLGRQYQETPWGGL